MTALPVPVLASIDQCAAALRDLCDHHHIDLADPAIREAMALVVSMTSAALIESALHASVTCAAWATLIRDARDR